MTLCVMVRFSHPTVTFTVATVPLGVVGFFLLFIPIYHPPFLTLPLILRLSVSSSLLVDLSCFVLFMFLLMLISCIIPSWLSFLIPFSAWGILSSSWVTLMLQTSAGRHWVDYTPLPLLSVSLLLPMALNSLLPSLLTLVATFSTWSSVPIPIWFSICVVCPLLFFPLITALFTLSWLYLSAVLWSIVSPGFMTLRRLTLRALIPFSLIIISVTFMIPVMLNSSGLSLKLRFSRVSPYLPPGVRWPRLVSLVGLPLAFDNSSTRFILYVNVTRAGHPHWTYFILHLQSVFYSLVCLIPMFPMRSGWFGSMSLTMACGFLVTFVPCQVDLGCPLLCRTTRL